MLNGAIGELEYWNELGELYADMMTASAVDSKLSLLFYDRYQLAKWLPNPFMKKYDNLPGVDGIRNRTIMVGRLDGPSAKDAKRLVDDAIEAEKEGLDGVFYIDARGFKGDLSEGSYAWYDEHLRTLAEKIKEKGGIKVVMDDKPGLFPERSCPNAALYCGWYSLANYVDSFDWRKGAVGYHVASGEAKTLKQRLSQVWCKRMIEKGVAATLGPVEEPFLLSFLLPDEFFPLLMSGTVPLLEVYFRTTPFLSWRQILIGDPLYTPFKTPPLHIKKSL